MKSGEYTFIEQLINEMKTKLKDKIHFDASPQEITNSVRNLIHKAPNTQSVRLQCKA